jgi:uncharacterized protein YidB (DUF937 family)
LARCLNPWPVIITACYRFVCQLDSMYRLVAMEHGLIRNGRCKLGNVGVRPNAGWYLSQVFTCRSDFYMAILDKLISLVAGRDNQLGSSDVFNTVLPLLTSESGLDGIIEKLNKSGLGSIASSWIRDGQNQPISAEQLQNALGDDHLDKLSNETGVPKGQLLSTLAENLPTLIDKLTPTGAIPEGGFTSAVLNLLRTRGAV